MSIETDLLLDRRRLKRRLFLWRTLAIIAVALAVAVSVGGKATPLAGRHIARITVSGIMTENRRLNDAVVALAKDDSVRALIVYIDSPGGSVAGGESLHDAIAIVAAKKPVVAVMGGTAASAGYMVAVATERIFAREATLTGSIGVLLETVEASGLLHQIGVSTEVIASGPLKDQPNFGHPLSPQGRQALQTLVMDMYDQFVAMVAAGRHMDATAVRGLADGRAYTGRQALGLGLIDQIGGEPEARAWLASAKNVPLDVPVQDLKIGTLAQRAFGAAEGTLFGGWIKTLFSQGLTLDGAWAIWQPSRQ